MKLLFRLKKYLQFLIRSKNEHAVHSPFVFQLVTNCFYKKNDSNSELKFQLYKQKLLDSDKIIEIIDFGSGSKVFKDNIRPVAKMAKVASLSTKNGLLLMRLIPFLKIKNCLELGTNLGIASAAMGFSSEETTVETLEGCPNISKIAQEHFDFFNLKNIHLTTGDFSETLEKVLENKKYDLIYFDGNHTEKDTLHYFQQALSSVHNDSLFIFDDIYLSQGMENAWEKIKKHPKVTVTIDTFQWGFVFFRREQVKEHFVIRF